MDNFRSWPISPLAISVNKKIILTDPLYINEMKVSLMCHNFFFEWKEVQEATDKLEIT